MGAKEKTKINEIFRSLPLTKRLFRANTGCAWVGEIVRREKNILILRNPRVFHGMPEGFPDLFGWEEIEITEDMVGQKIAVFCGEEVKVTGKLSKEQGIFGDLIKRMGGRFRVHR